MARRFEDLEVWKKAEDLAVVVYRASSTLPFSHDFALRDQVRRAAISVMSNIAEGFDRYSRAEFRHFLSVSRSSAAEVRAQLHLAHRLEYLDSATAAELEARCLEISRMLAALRRKTGPEE
jgi:four helix bundle protein